MPVRLWTEDECTRGLAGHEYLKDAWARIFGVPYKDCTPLEVIDHGDSDEKRFRVSGREIAVFCVYGAWNEIEEGWR